MSDLKRCACCGTDVEVSASSCTACGEGSWIETPVIPVVLTAQELGQPIEELEISPVLTSQEEVALGIAESAIEIEEADPTPRNVAPPKLRGSRKPKTVIEP